MNLVSWVLDSFKQKLKYFRTTNYSPFFFSSKCPPYYDSFGLRTREKKVERSIVELSKISLFPTNSILLPFSPFPPPLIHIGHKRVRPSRLLYDQWYFVVVLQFLCFSSLTIVPMHNYGCYSIRCWDVLGHALNLIW